MAGNLKKFVNPRFIKTIDLALMKPLLARHAGKYKGFSVDLLDQEEDAAREALEKLLTGAEDSYPEGLRGDLHRIAELGDARGLEIIQAQAARLVAAIGEGYDLIVVNFANPDMVGHTGSLPAATRACEAVDRGVGEMIAALEQAGGAAVIIADHGNCETMIDPVTGGPHTAHTTNPVPVIVWNGPEGATVAPGRLADVAPTVLDLMGLDLPPQMTGASLIRRA